MPVLPNSTPQDPQGNAITAPTTPTATVTFPSNPPASATVAPPVVVSSNDARLTTQSNLDGVNKVLTSFQQNNGGSAAAQFMDGSGFDAQGNFIPAPTPPANNAGMTPGNTAITPAPGSTTTPPATNTPGSTPPPASPTSTTTPPPPVEDPSVTAIKQIMSTSDQAYADYMTKVNNLYSGTTPLSPDDQATLDLIKSSVASQIRSQQQINTATLDGLTQSGIVSGRNRYAQDIETGILAKEQDDGLARITDIQNKGLQLIQTAKQAIQDRNYKLLNDSYTAFTQNQNSKSDALMKLLAINQQQETLAQQKARDAQTRLNEDRTFQLDVTKNQQAYNKDNGIVGRFYQKPGNPTVYDANTGLPVTYDQYKAAGGTGLPGAKFGDVQVITPTGKQYPAGMVGEYQFYYDQEIANGRKPMDFNSYQNVDANRKKAIARAGTGGGGTSAGDVRAAAAALKGTEQTAYGEVIDKWNSGFIQGNNTISSKDYKIAKSQWTRTFTGDVADPGKQFDNLFIPYVDQSGDNWQKDYGIN